MLGQRYTTLMITVVCPVTKLHHMASLQVQTKVLYQSQTVQYTDLFLLADAMSENCVNVNDRALDAIFATLKAIVDF